MNKINNLRALLLVCCFFSGAACLMYELLWVKLFSLVFGHTTFALSTVLAAFMAGLALGSRQGGRFADGPGVDRLRAYAWVEAAIGLCGLASWTVIRWTDAALIRAGMGHWTFWWQSFGWFFVFFCLLILPTFLMGMTLPLLLTGMINRQESAGTASRWMSQIYGVNTAGAAAGALAAGLWLPSILGVKYSLYLGAGFNFFAAVLCRFGSFFNPEKEISRWSISSDSPGQPPDARQAGFGNDATAAATAGDMESAGSSRKKLYVRIVTIAALTGFASLTLEIVWTRALALALGSTIHAFSIMLTTYLLGMAFGSFFFRRLPRNLSQNLIAYGWALFGLSLASLLTLPLLGESPYLFSRAISAFGNSWGATLTAQFLISFLVLAGPTFLMGILLPWGFELINQRGSEGSKIGGLYAANTGGSIAGSVLGGFLLVPWLGLELTIVIGALIQALACFIAFGESPAKQRTFQIGAAGTAMLAAIILIPRWNEYAMASGVYFYQDKFSKVGSRREFLTEAAKNLELLYYDDGLSATISVFEEVNGTRSLVVNGKTDASSGSQDMTTQVMLGGLPFLLHSGPKRALVIGYGSGVSAGYLAAHPGIEAVDVVEIEPAVVGASRYFESVNFGAAENPKIRIIYTDARHYLSTTKERYDIIASGPSNPWLAGIAGLYTQEAFRLANQALAPGGIFCQWFNGYNIKTDDFLIFASTLLSVFPQAQLFNGYALDFLAVASNGPWNISYPRIKNYLETPGAPQKMLGLLNIKSPEDILISHYLMDSAGLYALAGPDGNNLHTDGRPILEYSSARHFRNSEKNLIRQKILDAKKRLFPEGLDNPPKKFNQSEFPLAF